MGGLLCSARRHALRPWLALWHIRLRAGPGQLPDRLHAAHWPATLRSARDRYPADQNACSAFDYSSAVHRHAHTTDRTCDGAAQCHAISHANTRSALAYAFSDSDGCNTAFGYARGQRHTTTTHADSQHHALGSTADGYHDTDPSAAYQHSAAAHGNSAAADKYHATTDPDFATAHPDFAADEYAAAAHPHAIAADSHRTATNKHSKTFGDTITDSFDIAPHAQKMVRLH